MSGRKVVRTIIGFLVAPLSPLLLVGVIGLLKALLLGGEWRFQDFWFLISVVSVALYPIVVVVGIPLFLVMTRLNLTKAVHYLAYGAVLGLVVAFIFGAGLKYGYVFSADSLLASVRLLNVPLVLMVMLSGMWAALVLWVIVRPDRQA